MGDRSAGVSTMRRVCVRQRSTTGRRRGAARRQAGLDVGDVRVDPGRVGRQAGEQPLQALRRVHALQASQVADERLRAAVLVDGLELPEAQLVGLAQARDDDADEVERDVVLDRPVRAREGRASPRPSHRPWPARRRDHPARDRRGGRPSARHPGVVAQSGFVRQVLLPGSLGEGMDRAGRDDVTDTTNLPAVLTGSRRATR